MSKLPVLITRISGQSSANDGVTEIAFVFQESSKASSQESKKKVLLPSRKSKYLPTLQRLVKDGIFQGKAKTQQFIRFVGVKGAENVLFIGMGAPDALDTPEKARVAGGLAYAKLKSESVKHVVVDGNSWFEVSKLKSSGQNFLQAFLEGLLLSHYEIVKPGALKTEKNKSESTELQRVEVLVEKGLSKSELQNMLQLIQKEVEMVHLTRDWSNLPSNIGTPTYYANEISRLAKRFGISVKVLSKKDAAREKMGLFLGVGQSSKQEGKVVILDYRPKKQKKSKTIAFVGKGVTFDSGGISLKPANRMEEMKHDMTGAATVVAATFLAAQLGAPNRIVTIVGFTENMPGGDAIQPGNVLNSRSGKTVEIVNTDAEGRLVLGDLLDYIKDYEPDAIVDAATLTGAVTVALGRLCCAVMGNDQALMESLIESGEECGERIWQLPLWDEYFDDMKSVVADLRNSCNDSYGGSIRGGIFLKQFVPSSMKWAHLDIAATAWDLGFLPYCPKTGATGTHVRTLTHFAMNYK